MTSERLNMSIKFYTSQKNFIPQKQISGYAPDHDIYEKGLDNDGHKP